MGLKTCGVLWQKSEFDYQMCSKGDGCVDNSVKQSARKTVNVRRCGRLVCMVDPFPFSRFAKGRDIAGVCGGMMWCVVGGGHVVLAYVAVNIGRDSKRYRPANQAVWR